MNNPFQNQINFAMSYLSNTKGLIESNLLRDMELAALQLVMCQDYDKLKPLNKGLMAEEEYEHWDSTYQEDIEDVASQRVNIASKIEKLEVLCDRIKEDLEWFKSQLML
jgi:hypothetical protein